MDLTRTTRSPARWLRPALLLSALTLSVACGSGPTSPPPPPPTGVISIAPSAGSGIIEQGGQAAITVLVTRAGSFTGAVTLTVEGLPTGVTAAQSNVTTNGATTSATITFTVTTSAVPGRTDLTLRATGSGVTDATALFQLTVTAPPPPAYQLSVTGSPLTVPQGGNGQATIALGRSGGFAGNVVLTVEGAPPGLNATLNPAATTGSLSTLTVIASAGLTPNTYSMTIRGVAAGLTDRTVTVQVTVTAVSGTGNVILNFSQCGSPYAIWVAYRDGAGAWTRVTSATAIFQFTVNSPTAAFAYVVRQGGSSATTTTVQYMTRAEMSATPFVFCPPGSFGQKFINGAVVGFAGNQSALVTMGGGLLATPTFQFPTFVVGLVPDGDRDFVAYRWGGIPAASDRVIIRRDLNLPNGGSVGNLDFAAAEAVAVAPATLTVNGLIGTEGMLETMTLLSRATCDAAWLYQTGATGAVHQIYGVPASLLRPTDFHTIRISASNPTGSRYVEESFRGMADRTLTLGGRLDPVAVSILPGTYKRLEGVFGLPLVYNVDARLYYIQTSGIPRAVDLVATPGWVASTTATLTMPDFSAVTGWSDTWAPSTALATRWTITATGRDGPGNRCRDGARLTGASVSATN